MDIEQARQQLESEEVSSRRAAVEFLIEKGSRETADLLKLFLDDANETVSGLARAGLKKLCFPVEVDERKINIDKFEELMQSPDPVYRTRVIMTARKFKQAELLPYYIANLYEEEDEFVIATLIQAIGEAGDTAVIPTLARFLKHGSGRVRANAIEALGIIGGDEVPSLIEPMVDDTHHRVRICAVKELWDLGDRNVLEKLNWMMRSDLPADRASAVFMLGMIDDPDTIPPLMDAVEDEDESVRKKVFQSLGYKINDPRVREMLMERLFSSQENVSGMVKNIFETLKGNVLCRNCGTLNPDSTNFCGRCGRGMNLEKIIAFDVPTEEEIEQRAVEVRKQKLKERALKQLASAQERGLKKRSWKKSGRPSPVDFDDDIDSI